MSRPIPTASPRNLLPPLLASLPAAAVSTQPPTALLPLLSPILRQRIQFLSAAGDDPWLPLLCYDQEKASQLIQIAKGDAFEPHPVSGEVEVDWDGDVETRYRRIDEETLEAYVVLHAFGLIVKLLWCMNDQEGGSNGWRIGQVGIKDHSLSSQRGPQGCESINEAEASFKGVLLRDTTSRSSNGLERQAVMNGTNRTTHSQIASDEEEEDDDAYWAQYDQTPARTPASNRSPAPTSTHQSEVYSRDADDAYYAQYASVQPAMDAHDPDEASPDEIAHRGPLFSHDNPELAESSLAWNDEAHTASISRPGQIRSTKPFPPHLDGNNHNARARGQGREPDSEIAHPQPRPTSSSSSSGASMIAKLENTAAAQVQAEVGIKQHISTSIKSMYRLAKAGGVERAEFERLVQIELKCLSMMEEGEDD